MCGTDIVFFSINATHSSNHDLHERLRLYSSYESLALDICSDKVSQNQSPANHNVAKAGNLCPELLYVRLMYCIARPLMAVQYLRTVIRRKVNVREVWSTTLRKHKIPMKAPEDLSPKPVVDRASSCESFVYSSFTRAALPRHNRSLALVLRPVRPWMRSEAGFFFELMHGFCPVPHQYHSGLPLVHNGLLPLQLWSIQQPRLLTSSCITTVLGKYATSSMCRYC